MDYKSSGVDIDAGNETVRRIKRLAKATFTPGVLSDIGSFGGLFKLDTAAWQGAGAGVERRRRRHQAESRVHGEPAPHDRRRPRQPLRQRHPRAGRDAAVLSRLPRDRPAVARRRRTDRRGPREGLQGQRLRAARRRNRGDARLLRRRRIRRRRLHRRRRRSRADRRRPLDRCRRRADRLAVDRPAHQRLFAGAQDRLRRAEADGRQPCAGAGRDRRRRVPAHASLVSAGDQAAARHAG